jgi:hypothetical protein
MPLRALSRNSTARGWHIHVHTKSAQGEYLFRWRIVALPLLGSEWELRYYLLSGDTLSVYLNAKDTGFSPREEIKLMVGESGRSRLVCTPPANPWPWNPFYKPLDSIAYPVPLLLRGRAPSWRGRACAAAATGRCRCWTLAARCW